MIVIKKQKFLKNLHLKLICLMLGYIFWSFINKSHIIDLWIDVPLSFYDIPKNIIIDAPENVTLNISGKRSLLKTINTKNLAIHLDMHTIKPGSQKITITENNLFLPETIQAKQFEPTIIHIKKKKIIDKAHNEQRPVWN